MPMFYLVKEFIIIAMNYNIEIYLVSSKVFIPINRNRQEVFLQVLYPYRHILLLHLQNSYVKANTFARYKVSQFVAYLISMGTLFYHLYLNIIRKCILVNEW